jgi:hypothetical protein
VQRLNWLFPASSAGWIVLVVLTAGWPRFALSHGLPAFPANLGGWVVLGLLAATVLGGLALGGHRPEPAREPVAITQPTPPEMAQAA